MTNNLPEDSDDETSQHIWIRPEQFEKLIKVAYNVTEQHLPGREEPVTGWEHLSQRDELIIQVFYDTGLRLGELQALNESDLRLQADEPHIFLRPEIQRQPAKGRPRSAARMTFDLPMTAQKLRLWKQSRWKDGEPLFPSQQNNRMTRARIGQVVEELAVEAGIRPYKEDGSRAEPSELHPHAFRHSMAYRYLVVEGKSIEDVKNRLRHRSLKVTERFYEHFIMR